MSPAQRRQMVDREHPFLSLVRQCALLGVSRSSVYYRPRAASEQDLSLMGEIDRQYLETPFYGSRRMKACLERRGEVEPIIWTGSGRSYVRIPALLPVIRSPLPVNPSFH